MPLLNDNKSFNEIYTEISQESILSLDFVVLSILSCLIATFGLLLNSGAIIIGAMILAPFMSPLLAISFSGLLYRKELMAKSIITIGIGIIIACLVSAGVGFIFHDVGLTSEMMARTRPNIMDFFVALAAGFLGGYVKIRKPLSGTVPGVAISISLMPPLCVTGIGLAHGEPHVYLGASLLFLTNFACIVLSGLLAFWLVDYQYLPKNPRALVWPSIISLLLSIPLIFNFMNLIEEGRLKRTVSELLLSKTYTFKTIDVSHIEVDTFHSPVLIKVTVNTAADQINPRQVRLVRSYLSQHIGKPLSLEVNFTPTTQIIAPAPQLLKSSDQLRKK